MFATAIRRSAASPLPAGLRSTRQPLTGVYNSRYKPKKVWPPDFSKLSDKEKFRFERKYKRRIQLATARPNWDKYVRLAQLASITGVLLYAVLLMVDPYTERQPFQGVRDKFWSAVGYPPNKAAERRKEA